MSSLIMKSSTPGPTSIHDQPLDASAASLPQELSADEAIGQILPDQEKLNSKAHVNHPAQYKKIGRRGSIVTVKNVATGLIVDLDQRTELGQKAWKDIQDYKEVRRRRALATKKI